ncbi:MAG: single-stranded DNA-binding protein [Cyanobacteriota bacterium]|nr:single-stranded DNA-binding protein [Cyanobacteriota bacterium]
MSLNVVTLVGRAGRDPEVKYFESGSVVCNLTLAVNRLRKNEDPDWFNLEIWDKTAEIAANYVRKGSLIGVKGSLKFDYWDDRATGVKRSKPVIRVYQLDLLGSKRDNESAAESGYEEF